MKKNFHNHTYRCFHAHGEDEDFVLAAIENGFDEIGFSDHCAWHFDKGFVSGMRMREDQIPDYVSSVRVLQEKYSGKIKIHLGWEVEYFRKYMPWMKKTLRTFGFDYIILGHHFYLDESGTYNGAIRKPEEIKNYSDDVCEAMETDLFTYVAHPDLYMRSYPVFDSAAREAAEKIIGKSIETETPLEFNILGFENRLSKGEDGYPYPAFWRIAAEMGATAIIGIDAHLPDKYYKRKLIEIGETTLRGYGIKVIDKPLFRQNW